MVSLWGRKRTLADKTVYQNGSIDTSFGPPPAPLDSTFTMGLNPKYSAMLIDQFSKEVLIPANFYKKLAFSPKSFLAGLFIAEFCFRMNI
jgi:hypothetical protein